LGASLGRSHKGLPGVTGVHTMREEDLDSYFKFMEHYERFFSGMQKADFETQYEDAFKEKYRKTLRRSNFLQNRTT
jgi:branched-subunit amino acid aminotransferase/4-amino-4-deoxychorismate lyase